MNEHTESNTDFERRLDRLAQADRGELDAGFEDRVWHAMQQPAAERIPGRRRKSTAWIPFVTAACVGIMGYIVWMPMINVDTSTRTDDVAAVETENDSMEILLSSFDTMDLLIAGVDEMDENLSVIELQMDATEVENDAIWQDYGGAL